MRIGLLLLLFPFFLTAQTANKTYLTAGLMHANTHFETYERYIILSNTGSYRSTGRQSRRGNGTGFSLGLSHTLHPRWEVAAAINYTGATIKDTINLINLANFDLPDIQPVRDRRIRAFWSEALLFWRIVGDRSLADIQLGTGLVWLASTQAYDSGFTLDQTTNVYDYYYTTERINGLGIPVHFKIQYPLNYHFKVGGALQVNTYFGGKRQQANLTAFVAYRW